MKKNFFEKSMCAALLLMGVTFTGCVNETDEEVASGNGGKGNLYITIQPERIGTTRSGTLLNNDPSNESKFGKTLVALFNGTGDDATLVETIKEIDFSSDESATATFDGGDFAATYTVAVATNIPGDATTAPYKTLKDATTLGAFKAVSLDIKNALNGSVITATDADRRLPMFGYSTISQNDGDWYANIVAKHSLAKVTLEKLAVDFSESKFRNATFTPEQVFLTNVPDETKINPASIAALTIGASDHKMYQGDYYMNYRTAASAEPEAIYPDADYAKLKVTAVTGIDDNVIGTDELSPAETALSSGDVWSKSFYFYTLPNNNATFPTYLVVSGTFNDGTNTSKAYYAAKLSGTDNTNNYQVEPNYNYKVNMLLRQKGGTDAYAAGGDPTVASIAITPTAFTDNSTNAVLGATTDYTNTSDAVMTESGVPVKVGDILFQDGTFVSKDRVTAYMTANTSAVPMGIVFHLLTGTEDYGTYTHGLVMALKEATTSAGVSTGVKWNNNTTSTLLEDGGNSYLFTLSAASYAAAEPTVGSAELISLENSVAADIKNLTTAGNNGLTNWGKLPGDYSSSAAFTKVSEFQTAAGGVITGCSNWFLPSVGEWYKICYSLGKLDATQCQGAWNGAVWGNNATTSGDWTTYGMFYYNGTAATPTECNKADGGAADYTRAAINTAMSVVGTGNYDAIYGGLHPDANTAVNSGSAAAATGSYWCSSEWSASHAFRVNFSSNGTLGFDRYDNKSYQYRVRPVLAF